MKYIVIYITCANTEEAEKISSSLIEKKLIACANLVPGIQSLFRWEGEVCKESEILLILKTTDEKFEPILNEVKKLHSYDTPEVIALPIINGSEDYLKWISDETQ